MRKLAVPLSSLIAGLLVGSLGTRCFEYFKFNSYQTMNQKIRRIDPYQRDEKTKQALSGYFDSLPQDIQNDIRQRSPGFAFLTSCRGDVIPGGTLEYAVGYIDNDKAKFFVYHSEGSQLKAVDISKEISFRPSGQYDYPEVQCRHGGYLIANGDFKLIPGQQELANRFQLSNREILQIRSRQASDYGLFAYNAEDSKYHQIGTIPVLLP